MIIDLNNKPLPTESLFLNGTPYTGKVAFINGYNGYNTTKEDSMMCAVIEHSCFNKNVEPNYIRNINGDFFRSTNRRGRLDQI